MFDTHWDQFKYYASTFLTLGLIFGFIGYWGFDIRFLLFNWTAEGAQLLSDSYGHLFVGHGIMGLALALWGSACAYVWRTGFF